MGTPNALAAAADFDGANAAYSALADLYPHRADPWLGLAGIAQRQGDLDAALEALQAAVEADPQDLDAFRQLALFYEGQARYEEAMAAYGAMVALDAANPDLRVARATAAARLGRADEAVADLQAAQALDPYLQYAWLNVAAAATGARAYDAATTIATAGLDQFPDSVSLHVARGLALLSSGEAEAALENFDAAVALDALSIAAFHWRGRTLAVLGRTEEAIADLQQAGQIGVLAGVEGINEGYEAMADAADLMAQDDPQAAFAYLADQVIRHGSQDALLMGYARIDWRRGNTALALGRLNNLVRDGFVPALYWRGVIHADEGNAADAISDLRDFLALRRYGPDVESARALLESLGVDPDTISAAPSATSTP